MRKLFVEMCKKYHAEIIAVLTVAFIVLICSIITPGVIESNHQTKQEQLIEKLNTTKDENEIITINTLIELENQEYIAEKEVNNSLCQVMLCIALITPVLLFLWILEKVIYKTWRGWYLKS